VAANGISTLEFKRARQEAKLTLAAQNRTAQDKPDTYDINRLPTKYANSDNNTNNVVDNPNTGGLKPGRPWII
jgi:hypothetical protein